MCCDLFICVSTGSYKVEHINNVDKLLERLTEKKRHRSQIVVIGEGTLLLT